MQTPFLRLLHSAQMRVNVVCPWAMVGDNEAGVGDVGKMLLRKSALPFCPGCGIATSEVTIEARASCHGSVSVSVLAAMLSPELAEVSRSKVTEHFCSYPGIIRIALLALACCGASEAQCSISSNIERDFSYPSEPRYQDGRTAGPCPRGQAPLQDKCKKIYWLPRSFFLPGWGQ
jgi:hypothetical protein